MTRYNLCVIAHNAGEQFSRSLHKNKHTCRSTFGSSCCVLLWCLLFSGARVCGLNDLEKHSYKVWGAAVWWRDSHYTVLTAASLEPVGGREQSRYRPLSLEDTSAMCSTATKRRFTSQREIISVGPHNEGCISRRCERRRVTGILEKGSESRTWTPIEPESSLPSSGWWPKNIWSRSKVLAFPAPSKEQYIFPNLGGRKWHERKKLKWKESSGPEWGKQPQQPRRRQPRGPKRPGSPNLGAQSPGPWALQARTKVNSFLVSCEERGKMEHFN